MRVISIVLTAGLIAGCGGNDSGESGEQAMDEAAARYGIDADVTLSDTGEQEKVVINAGGSQVGQNLDLPAGFPDDIRLPADWNIIGASSPRPGSHNLQALSAASSDDIVREIRARLTETGWSETASASPAPGMARISLVKGDRMANFNIIENGGSRMIQILIMRKP